jgi:hypothetical protein
MANREKGEVDLVINGTTYTLTLKTAALMALQKHFSTPEKVADLDQIMERANAGSIEDVVAVLWASMQKFHPDVTFERAVNLIDDLGGIGGLGAAMKEVTASMAPDPADVKELAEVPKSPRKARATRGTGETGTSKLAASA